MTEPSPFKYFKISPAIIPPAVRLYVGFAPSLGNVEDLLQQRWIDVSVDRIRC